MRSLLVLALAAGCGESLPPEAVSLTGFWVNEYRSDTYEESFQFEERPDGSYGGHWHLWAGIDYHADVDTAWVTYPVVEIRVLRDQFGQCPPVGVISRCSVTGRFVAEYQIQLGEASFRRRGQ